MVHFVFLILYARKPTVAFPSHEFHFCLSEEDSIFITIENYKSKCLAEVTFKLEMTISNMAEIEEQGN